MYPLNSVIAAHFTVCVRVPLCHPSFYSVAYLYFYAGRAILGVTASTLTEGGLLQRRGALQAPTQPMGMAFRAGRSAFTI